MCQESNQKKFKVTKRIVKFPLFKRKRSIDLLYNNLNILNITELYLELVRCMFIYIDFYHNAKTLLIFFKGTYWLRLRGCLIVDPASDSRESFTCTLLDFYLSFTPFVLLLALFLSLFLLYWLFFSLYIGLIFFCCTWTFLCIM